MGRWLRRQTDCKDENAPACFSDQECGGFDENGNMSVEVEVDHVSCSGSG